jgi:hypothetical protein
MREDPKKMADSPSTTNQDDPTDPALCACIQDPYANLPPEMRPRPVKKMGGLRKSKCPGCGLSFWTNRETDYCMDCEKTKKKESAPG